MIQFLIKRNRDITKKIKRREKYEENFIYKENAYCYIKEFEYDENIIKYLNCHYPSGIYRIVEKEYGGMEYNILGSKAQIVCDINGEKLIPIKRYTKGNRANKIHAEFLAYSLCVVQCKFKKDNIVEFKLIKKEINKYTGEYKEKLLWQGNQYNVEKNCPMRFTKYKKAIMSCIEKLRDYKCIDIYYYMD